MTRIIVIESVFIRLTRYHQHVMLSRNIHILLFVDIWIKFGRIGSNLSWYVCMLLSMTAVYVNLAFIALLQPAMLMVCLLENISTHLGNSRGFYMWW